MHVQCCSRPHLQHFTMHAKPPCSSFSAKWWSKKLSIQAKLEHIYANIKWGADCGCSGEGSTLSATFNKQRVIHQVRPVCMFLKVYVGKTHQHRSNP